VLNKNSRRPERVRSSSESICQLRTGVNRSSISGDSHFEESGVTRVESPHHGCVTLKNPIVTISINDVPIGNNLIDLGAVINIMIIMTMETLELNTLLPTPTVLKLVDRSRINPVRVLDDILITLNYWEYPVDFLVIQPKTNMVGHPVILGRPWLATTNAFIRCRSGEMTISNGLDMNILTLYPPTKPALQDSWQVFESCENTKIEPPEDKEIESFEDAKNESLKIVEIRDHRKIETLHPLVTLKQERGLKIQSQDDFLNLFISVVDCTQFPEVPQIYNHIFHKDFQENFDPTRTTSFLVSAIKETIDPYCIIVEISPGKTLNINVDLDSEQHKQLVILLQKHFGAFFWDYKDMPGIHPDTCTHHIYLQENAIPIRQPQLHMNLVVKDIVKEELQTLPDVNFIYPISNSKWVSPVVVVPKKESKWRICV
jgi:hypothetical protein